MSRKWIRNSTVEFLIFTGQAGEQGIEAHYEDETIWLPQKTMAKLFAVDARTISEHLKNIFQGDELQEEAVIRKFRITAAGGGRGQPRFYTVCTAGGKVSPVVRQLPEAYHRLSLSPEIASPLVTLFKSGGLPADTIRATA